MGERLAVHRSDQLHLCAPPGDTIYISGGTVSKTYNGGFARPKSGTPGNVITISTGQDAGHTGVVIIIARGFPSPKVFDRAIA